MTEKEEFQKACEIIPSGVQTMSKQPCRYVEGTYPYFIERGKGAYVWDKSDKQYIDYPCGLGSILLGYNDDYVNNAIIDQLRKGTIFSLSNRLEGELAEKIKSMIPCAEMVRFVKTGSESASAAVRIARAYTGRDNIIYAGGYHGWHDWYISSKPDARGIPKVLKNTCNEIPYNDLTSLKVFLDKDTAAVILEPYIYDSPQDDYLAKLIEMAHNNGSLVIFDEVITGLRTIFGSAQKFFGVVPDLACFGKAFGNGLPIAFVCGKKSIMDELTKGCFVSSTFGGDLLGLSAAKATMEMCEKLAVADFIWERGAEFKNGFNKITRDYDLDIPIIGYPCRTSFKFPSDTHRSLFWQECVKRGVLFGHAQFINYSHDTNIITKTINVMWDALGICKEYWEHPEYALIGPEAKESIKDEIRHIDKKGLGTSEKVEEQPKDEAESADTISDDNTNAGEFSEPDSEQSDESTQILGDTEGECTDGNGGSDEYPVGEQDSRNQPDSEPKDKKKKHWFSRDKNDSQ